VCVRWEANDVLGVAIQEEKKGEVMNHSTRCTRAEHAAGFFHKSVGPVDLRMAELILFVVDWFWAPHTIW
jgi:hypothetical protein